MSKKNTLPFGAEFVLQLCIGAFFLAAGILGVTNYNSNLAGVMRFLGKNDTLNIVVAVVQIAMAAVLLVGLVAKLKGAAGRLLGLILALLWAIWIVVLYFFTGKPFQPDFLTWLYGLSRDLIILVALWIVARRFAAD